MNNAWPRPNVIFKTFCKHDTMYKGSFRSQATTSDGLLPCTSGQKTRMSCTATRAAERSRSLSSSTASCETLYRIYVTTSTIGNLEYLFFLPISALCSKFYPRNIKHMPAVKFLACLGGYAYLILIENSKYSSHPIGKDGDRTSNNPCTSWVGKSRSSWGYS